jgi:hypothetical protein
MMTKRPLLVEELETRVLLTLTELGTPYTLPTTDRPWQTTPFLASPIFADLDGSGHDELIVAASGGRLLALTDTNGQATLWQTYDTAPVTGVLNHQIKGTPIVVTLPNGHKGIFAALSRDETHPNTIDDDRVFGWDAVTGALLAGWPAHTGFNGSGGSGVIGALTSGDLNGDGQTEIIVTSISGYVTAFRLDGSIMWQYLANDTIQSGAVVADIDGDGKPEVIFGSDASFSPNPANTGNSYTAGGFVPSFLHHNGGFINILDNMGQAKYRYPINEVAWSSPVVADLNNDGHMEIVTGTGLNFSVTLTDPTAKAAALAAANRIYALDYKGDPLSGWPYHTTANDAQQHQTYGSVAVADLLGDGHLEIVAVDYAGYVHVIQANGQPLPGWAGGKPIQVAGTVQNFASPIIADINGDGKPDIIVTSGNVFEAFDASGNVIFGPTSNREYIGTAAAVGNFAGSGGLVLASLSGLQGTQQPHTVTFYQLPASTLPPPWPMLRRSASGVAVAQSPSFATTYINNVFNAFLNRLPKAGGLQTFTNALLTNQFDLKGIAEQIATGQEYRGRVVDSWFQKLLGRLPRPAGRANRIAFLATHTQKDLAIALATSLEFQNDGAMIQPNPSGSIILFYRDVLGRDPNSNELSSGLPFATIANNVLTSNEHIDPVVSAFYTAFGSSAPAADSLASLRFGYRRGSREEQVLASVVASGGNYAATHTLAAWIRTVIRDNLNRESPPSEVATWVSLIDSGTATETFVRDILGSTEARNEYVTEQYRRLLGRTPSSTEIAALAGYARREDVVTFILKSPEYFNVPQDGNGTMQGFITAFYRDMINIYPVSQATINSLMQTYNASNRGQWIDSLFSPTPTEGYRSKNAIDLLFKYRPEENKGYLRTGNGSTVNNPDQTQLNAWDAYLGSHTDEDMITALTLDGRYVLHAAYYKGFYEKPMIRSWQPIAWTDQNSAD